MNLKTHKKIGFLASMAMVLGSVVGIGIFLKNHSILWANNWSGSGTLVSWLIGGALALFAAISFSEISGQKNGKTIGLPDWSEKAVGKKFGYVVSVNYTLFYWSLLTLVIGIFASETIFGIFNSILNTDMPHFGYVVLLAVALVIVQVLIVLYSIRTAGNIQLITTVLKFIPLVLVGLLGISLATTNHPPTTNSNFGHNAFTNGKPFDFVKILSALPAVLFAYDAFLTAAQIKHKMKDESKLPLAVGLGMIIIIVIYMIIAVAAILHGSGMVSGGVVGKKPSVGLGIFDQIFPPNIAKGFGTFVIIFLAISTYGVLNGLTTATVYTYLKMIEHDVFFGTKKLKKRFGNNKTILIYLFGTLTFYFLTFVLPGILNNNDAIVDAASNVPVLLFFAVYVIVILSYTIKRDKIKNSKINNKLFKISSWSAVFGISLIFLYQLLYGLSTNLLMHWDSLNGSGLFANHGSSFRNIDLFIVFISQIIIFIILPIINYVLIKKFEKRNPIVSLQ